MIEQQVAHDHELVTPSTGVRQVPRLLSPFRVPAYRRMAVALVCGAFAYGVWTIALVWEVIRIGGGPAQLSIVSTAGAVGVVLPALLAGVVADRVPQKLIVMSVATAEVVCYTVITVLSLTEVTRLWHLAVVSLCLGMGMAFYYAAYSAWLPAVVPASDLQAVNGFEGMVRPLVAAGDRAGRGRCRGRPDQPGHGHADRRRGGGSRRPRADRAPADAGATRPLGTADSSAVRRRVGGHARGRDLHAADAVAAGDAAVRLADGAGDDGALRGADPVRGQGPARGYGRPTTRWCSRPSASAARWARWRWPRSGCPGAT